MRVLLTLVLAAIQFSVAAMIGAGAQAQSELPRLVAKNGESVELHSVFFVASCRSIMIGLPEVEVVEGPPEVTLSIKEEPVLPRRLNCANKVPGGTLSLNAKGITESKEAKLVYRLKYKTKDGDRQTSRTYVISLFP